MTARATEAAIRREAAALVAAGLRIVRVLVRRDGTREYVTTETGQPERGKLEGWEDA